MSLDCGCEFMEGTCSACVTELEARAEQAMTTPAEEVLRNRVQTWRGVLYTMALENQALTEEQADRLLVEMLAARPSPGVGEEELARLRAENEALRTLLEEARTWLHVLHEHPTLTVPTFEDCQYGVCRRLTQALTPPAAAPTEES